MREIDESNVKKKLVLPSAAVGGALLIGLGVGYTSQTGKIAEAQDRLSDAHTQISLLATREQSLSAELERASTSSKDLLKARSEIATLDTKLSRTQEEARASEQRLQAKIDSLQAELDSAQKRAEIFAKISGQDMEAGSKNLGLTFQSDGVILAKASALSRNKQLLEKFTLVSNGTRGSAVYKHKFLDNWRKIKSVSIIAALFLADITVDSAGNRHSVPFKSITMRHGDEVLTFSSIDSLKQYFSEHEIGGRKLGCTLKWESRNRLSNSYYTREIGDFSDLGTNTLEVELDGDYAKALRETFELSANFKELSQVQGN
jgi:hypothetical protein